MTQEQSWAEKTGASLRDYVAGHTPKRGTSLNPKTFVDEPTPEEKRIAYWEPFIVMPKGKAIAEVNRIEARIEVIKATMEKGGLSSKDWRTLGVEWGNLIRRSAQVIFGSIPGAWDGPDLSNAKKVFYAQGDGGVSHICL